MKEVKKKKQAEDDIKKKQPKDDIKKKQPKDDIKQKQPKDDIKKKQTEDEIRKGETEAEEAEKRELEDFLQFMRISDEHKQHRNDNAKSNNEGK